MICARMVRFSSESVRVSDPTRSQCEPAIRAGAEITNGVKHGMVDPFVSANLTWLSRPVLPLCEG